MAENDNIGHSEMLAVGTLLQGGKYRIEKCLASGGFGNTYVVQNTMLENRMAMKEFFMRGVSERDDQNTVSVSNAANQASFDSQRAKFKKEARRIFELDNAHIVKVYDLFDENGTTYYVMGYIDGESFSQRLKRTGKPLTEDEALDVLDQVLDALDTVHAQDIWHLDLKPGNIMVDSSGTVKLIDFGASKQMSAGDGYTTTSTALCYTPGYAPLEQIEQKNELIGPWTDLYALGATLYNLLTRQQPPTISELQEKDAIQYPASVSQRTRELISWMMSPQRTARPQSVAQVRQFLAGDSNTPVESKVKDPVDERTLMGDKPKESKVALADGDATVLGDKDKKSTSSSAPWKHRNQKKSSGTKRCLKTMLSPLWRKPKVLLIGVGVIALAILTIWIVGNYSTHKQNADEALRQPVTLPECPNPPRLVNDLAGVLGDTRAMEDSLEQFAMKTSNQIAVITVNDLQGEDALYYATQLGRKWGVGGAKHNNGVVILIKPKNELGDGKVAIAVGKGLEDVLSDVRCNSIINNNLIPKFKNNDYYGGVKDALNIIMPIVAKKYNNRSS